MAGHFADGVERGAVAHYELIRAGGGLKFTSQSFPQRPNFENCLIF